MRRVLVLSLHGFGLERMLAHAPLWVVEPTARTSANVSEVLRVTCAPVCE